MNTIIERINNYNYFIKKLKNYKKKPVKTNILGRGGQGIVYESCEEKNKCMAIKKIYIDKKLSMYFNDQYNPDALNNGVYIELLSNFLINQLVLQSITPHFVLNYAWDYRERERSAVCTDIYPYTMYHFNEHIGNNTVFTEWVKSDFDIKIWKNVYFQIIITLYSLQKYFNMTHFDLHSENVLVQKIPKGGYYEYILDNVVYYLPNLGFKVYIIDLGQASIQQRFKSWYIKNTFKDLVPTTYFDISFLFTSTESTSKSPSEFKVFIRNFINELQLGKHYPSTVYDNFYDIYYKQHKSSKLIDTFNLDKKLNTQYIPDNLTKYVLQ